MSRVNPQVEQLERMVRMLRADIERMRAEPGDSPLVGCGDSSCIIVTPRGQHTNGGCRCDEQRLRRAVQWWRRVAEHRQVTIQDMVGERAVLREALDVIATCPPDAVHLMPLAAQAALRPASASRKDDT